MAGVARLVPFDRAISRREARLVILFLLRLGTTRSAKRRLSPLRRAPQGGGPSGVGPRRLHLLDGTGDVGRATFRKRAQPARARRRRSSLAALPRTEGKPAAPLQRPAQTDDAKLGRQPDSSDPLHPYIYHHTGPSCRRAHRFDQGLDRGGLEGSGDGTNHHIKWGSEVPPAAQFWCI